MILAVSTNKGGVGKTTAVSNLASTLFRQGRRVLAVDTDNQGNLSLAFGLNPDEAEDTIYQAMTGRSHIDDCIYRVVSDGDGTPDGRCIDLLPAGDDMALFELEILSDSRNWPNRFDFLNRILTPLASEYDVILIDTPPNIGLISGNVLTAAHGILVPFQPERFAMRSLVKILQQIKDFGQSNDRLEFVGLFPALVARTNLHRDIMEEVRDLSEQEGFTVFDTVIPRSIRLAATMYYNDMPFSLYAPDDELSHAFGSLWAEIEEKSGAGQGLK